MQHKKKKAYKKRHRSMANIKFGQLLSIRKDIIQPEYLKELASNSIAQVHKAQIRDIGEIAIKI